MSVSTLAARQGLHSSIKTYIGSLAAKDNMIPSPKDLGLPSKYVTYRKGQDKAILDGIDCSRRFAAQVQRTGKGKTVTYMAQSILMKDSRTVILTTNKGLQDQLTDEWGDYELVDIRGKASYNCSGLPGKTCEDGALGKCSFKGSSMCEWGASNRAAKETKRLVTNYSCWTAANKYGQGFGEFDLMICDEAHNAPAEVAKAMRVSLSDREMELLKREWPELDTRNDMAVWKHWAAVTCKIAVNEEARLKALLDRGLAAKGDLVKDYKHIKNLARKLADVATCRPERWVVDDWKHGYQFDPIDASGYAERILFRGIEKIILTSGTIRPKTLEMLGVPSNEYKFYDYPSEINPGKSPFICVSTGIGVNYSTQEWEYKKLVGWIDKIIEGRLDRKGIIHTSNFKVRDRIYEYSKFSPKHNKNSPFLSNFKDKGDVTSEIIKQFKESSAPRLLISPSVTTGYDFPYDLCRYQILAKAPWGDIKSKLAEAKTELDKYSGAYEMMQSIAQAFGRGDRGDDDWQEFFSVDDNVAHALWKYALLGPSWLPAYIQEAYEIPEAPPLERAA